MASATGNDIQDMRAAAQEMPYIVVRVEANELAVQNAAQQLVPDRQNPVNLAAGERRVQEEPYADVPLIQQSELFAQKLRHQHQMVVVHPDQIAVSSLVGNGSCEQAIDLKIRIPRALVEHNLSWVVVKQGP